jgi:linalool dehydratase/isomerase-like protein
MVGKSSMVARLKRILSPAPMSLGRRLLAAGCALLLAAGVWLPCLHFFYRPSASEFSHSGAISPRARALAERHLELWTDPELRAREVAKMRGSNAEWDFMGRTFLVLALANMALREPAQKARYLEVMDRIIEETLRLEREEGIYFFLMDYARGRDWVAQPARSLFVDGEIALMLGMRRLVEEKQEYQPLLRERVAGMVGAMRRSPVLSGESYPDECWTFCNTVALAAIRVADALDGTDHSAFLEAWVRTAKSRLLHPESGLLVSSYTVDGEPMDGPEGSSIWMAAHCLQLVDPQFAGDQYRRAREELGREFLGFGYAAEWPRSWQSGGDIDSGPVVPLLDISPGASGLAFVGAAAFGDTTYLSSLAATLDLGGFPVRKGKTLRYAASNQVGDAVMLYSLVLGPAWKVVEVKTGHG